MSHTYHRYRYHHTPYFRKLYARRPFPSPTTDLACPETLQSWRRARNRYCLCALPYVYHACAHSILFHRYLLVSIARVTI
ncbi:hypothetical protein K504DRAFT_461040 [Pleomassaria siparia CBS 279.74]|uniref:Uncharacterized protein n=1 Tax=Pleomassaria siparia CBS 279.74 TaxID=1314801 RepID=A0A6G1JW01_9PLEO|nr:hypothetical protein K504DRAFT_461040 [Pleomassaria siparia CBS 279.74]